MPMKADGLDDLLTDIAGMASAMDADGAGAPTARKILTDAAQPIHQQMKANASKDDNQYQAVADEGENGFTQEKGATFLQSVYEPVFTASAE